MTPKPPRDRLNASTTCATRKGMRFSRRSLWCGLVEWNEVWSWISLAEGDEGSRQTNLDNVVR